jgi:hypothetical protein
MNIVIGSDHAGFPLKADVMAVLEELGHIVEDIGELRRHEHDLTGREPAHACRSGNLARASRSDTLDAPVSGGPVGAKNAPEATRTMGAALCSRSWLAARRGFRPCRARSFAPWERRSPMSVQAGCRARRSSSATSLICGINIQAICEALALGRASPASISSRCATCLLGGSAASWMLDKLGPAMIAGDAGAGFRIDLMLKDLRLVPGAGAVALGARCLPPRWSPTNMSRRAPMAKARTATRRSSGLRPHDQQAAT